MKHQEFGKMGKQVITATTALVLGIAAGIGGAMAAVVMVVAALNRKIEHRPRC
jgi:hypothetical protein